MESYWISPRAPGHPLPATEGRRDSDHHELPAWMSAEHRLRSSWDRFSAYGAAGILYRDTVIRPLHDRFNAGERTLDLLCAIQGL